MLNNATGQVPPGSELLAIDGMPVSMVMQAMEKHLSGDGDILTYKDAAIGDNFWLYYYLFIGQPEAFKVEYRSPNGQTSTAVLRGLTADAWKALDVSAENGAQKPLRYEALALRV